MPVISIRVSAELHERFLAECEKRDIRPGELGRRALEAITDQMIDAARAKIARVDPVAHAGKHVVRGSASRIRGFATDGSGPIAPPADRLKGPKK